MTFDVQRTVDIAIVIASVITAVVVLEGLIGVLRQALACKRGIAQITERAAPFDAEALERDLARIAAAGAAAGVLRARVVAARGVIAAGNAELTAAIERVKLLRARARALPKILSQPIRR
jgi:hypothetical protein